MADSTLTIARPELITSVGYFLGYNPSSLSAAQSAEIQRYIDSGLRRFFMAYNWRFLKPKTTLATVAATSDYTMPDSFGYLIGEMTYATADLGFTAIQLIPEQEIRKLQQFATTSAKPRYVSIRPVTTAGSTGQRFQATLWPTPDAVYTLTYQYHVLMDAVTSGAPYTYGGMAHSETILEACLAAAEQQADDEIGIHSQLYEQRLAESIKYDNQLEAEFFGYNGDPGMDRGGYDRRNFMNRTTVAGVTY